MARYYYDKKNTVEDYPKYLSIFNLKRDGFLEKWDYFKSGISRWTRNWETNGSIDFILSKGETEGNLRVTFTQTKRDTWEKTDHDYTIRLVSTPCHLWGRRWWFICPCKLNRCWKLYLQGNGIFASRKALNLSYESRNMSYSGRILQKVLGRLSGVELNNIRKSIKYPYRNGKPTRKMRTLIKHDLPLPGYIEEIMSKY